NPAAERIFNYSAREIIGKNVSLLMPDPFARAHDGHMQRERHSMNSSVIGVNREVLGKRKDGSVFPMDLSLSETELSDEYYYTGIVRDISSRKQIEEEALRFGRILDSSWNEIYIFDADSLRFTQVSHGVEVNLGYTEKEICELTAYDIKPEYSETQLREMIDPLRRGEVKLLTFKTIHRRKDGSTYPVEIRLQYAHSEKKPLYVAVVQDITERIKTEEYIQELSRFPEEAINPVLKVGGDGFISYANPASLVIRKRWESDVGEKVPGPVWALIKNSIENNTQRDMEVSCGSEIYLLVFSPVPELNAAYVYGRNITQHKKDQAELISHREHLEEMVNVRTKELASARNEAEQANRAKSQFLANMSHEIRTPLSAILGFAENLKEPDNSAAENRKAIDTIIRSSKHLSGIINDILDLSKIEANSIEAENIPFSLKDILYDLSVLIEPQAINKGLTFCIEYATPIPENISGDPVRLKQILINLCSNALKFTSEGEIKILASYDVSNRKVTFIVVDSGIGMSGTQLERLFKPFSQADSSTTRKYGGTGLGLALSRQLAELLGGSLDVKSEPEVGSQFILTLPVGDMDSELTTNTIQREREVVDSVSRTLKGKVLLAEDTPALQNLIGMHLKKIGFDFTIVENGLLAVEVAAENHFDLIFMDMQMPVMGGIEAVQILRNKGITVPIIALTANALLEEKTACLQAGCNQFVTKPVSRQELYEVAESFLHPIDVDNKELSPVVSDLLDDDPDMMGLVQKYVATLKECIEQIEFHTEQQNRDELRNKISHLHVTGGSYGFPFL
ncbi:MAG: PAS domain S-box protein, partial [Gammaproteobacteria bacterium]|nr:PAS domain S-box protein [Gammaproteobacteria bacterium]